MKHAAVNEDIVISRPGYTKVARSLEKYADQLLGAA